MKTDLKVEFAASPLAIGTRAPRFSWEVPLAGRGRRQSAYQILVASSEASLASGRGDLWDSGKVESSQSVHIVYAGAALRSNQDCFWKVQVWDEEGKATGFSQAACFGTALFDDADWNAQWIGLGAPDELVADVDSFQQQRVAPEIKAVEPDHRAPLMRKEFEIRKPVRRARAFICGLGLYELRMNGSKVGEEVLATSRTDFRKRALYGTYDLTPLLKTGVNALGLILGGGWFCGQKKYWGWQTQWYGSPRALLQVEIEFEDGSSQKVVSDGSWQGAWSPITFNCLYDGEDYDARLEQEGWDSAGFGAGDWQKVNVVAAPGGKLLASTHEPEKVVEALRPVSLREPKPGVYVYDLGRNIAGWARVRIKGGERGDAVKLRFAEALDAAGQLDSASYAPARHEDNYILKGSGEEVYEPRFTYHGFQFIELTGYPGLPDLDTVEGRFAHVAVEPIGSFDCASDFINNIHRCTVQSQLCNVQMGVPTDDTQRAERLGWGADAWASANEALYNLRMPRLYTKWIADFHDQQGADGMVGMIAPQPGPEEDLVWSAAYLLIPWWQYLHYGDRRLLEDSYVPFQRYLGYLEATGRKQIATSPLGQAEKTQRWYSSIESRFPAAEDRGFLQKAQWGDHLSTAEGSHGRSDLPLSIATAFYFLDVSIMARIAETLGRKDDVIRYRDLAGKIKEAFNARFFDPNVGFYDNGAQSAQAWPLAFGLVPEEHRKKVSDYLHYSVKTVQRRLTTGYIATKYAIDALTAAGHESLVWQLANATDYPSWGFMLRHNRTTTTETWDGDGGSLNHVALGAAIDEWFYSTLAGIRPDEAQPGFERIIIKPYLPADLQWVRATLKTLRGTVLSAWRQDGASAWLRLAVPANSTATVHIPAAVLEKITESGGPATEAKGVKLLRSENGETVFEVGSGLYLFVFPAPGPGRTG
jgi:alpha-L-rhamnosidase